MDENRLTQVLRDSYHHTHAVHVTPGTYTDISAMWPYFEENYDWLHSLTPSSEIVELGPGSGALLAWLLKRGYTRIIGVEVAREEAEAAKARGLPVVFGDAHDYLESRPASSIDAVVLKAVMEHMKKEVAADLLDQVRRVLRPDGFVVVDVPNMDWLFASHERYMDLTHETGFTRESLGQMLRLFFKDVSVVGSKEHAVTTWQRVRVRLVKPIVIRGLRLIARLLGEGASGILFESRSIIGVGKQPLSLTGQGGS